VAAHESGANFTRVDSAVFQYPLPAAFIGVTLSLKLQSYNIFGRSVEDLSECAAYTYTPSGVGSPIGPVTKSLKLGQNQDFRLVTEAVTEPMGRRHGRRSSRIDRSRRRDFRKGWQ
jgi:hypothetical protein